MKKLKLAYRRTAGLVTLALLGLVAPAAHAQPYDVSWWTVDGGGATSAAAGPYALGGTTGQPDAGGPFAGGPYVLHSGFWSLFTGGSGGPQADLAVTKTDGQTEAVPGQSVTYTIVVSNAGPSAVIGATVADTPPAALVNVGWTCTASPGSSCPASGTGPISAAVSLIVNGAATFTLTATIAPGAIGVLANTASVTAPPGVLDPTPANNSATDSDTLTPRADLALATSDAPDPAVQGGGIAYTLLVTNLGPSTSPAMTLTDTLSGQVSFLSVDPGPPACTHAAGTVTCGLGSLAASASTTVTIQVSVSPTASGSISNAATVAGLVTDPVASNDGETELTLVLARSGGELAHGTRLRADLAARPGPVADEDRYRISQAPYSSYEVVVDEASGDIGLGAGPLVERLAADGSTVLQTSLAAGTGPARSLRWENSTSMPVEDQVVRVKSASCGTGCDGNDTYRIRAYQTTFRVSRFNNSGSQVTVVLVQNPGTSPVAGHVYFWNGAGALLATSGFSLGPRQLLVLNTASVAELAGQRGTITLSHDGRYGGLAGKTVALEPPTGFSFDSPLEARPR